MYLSMMLTMLLGITAAIPLVTEPYEPDLKINCDEIRSVLMEGIDAKILEPEEVRLILRRCNKLRPS
tara:strand:- start:887 stop:1087 length:201 start_codon:yes stop_codon:yes gene_type:complete